MSGAEPLWLICHPPDLAEADEVERACRQVELPLAKLEIDQLPDHPPPRAAVVLSLEPLTVDQMAGGTWLQAGFEAGGMVLALGAAGTLVADLAGGVVRASAQPMLHFEQVVLTEEGALDPLAHLLREGESALLATALESGPAPGLTPLAYGGNLLLMEQYLERAWGVRGFPWLDRRRLEDYLARQEFLTLMDLCRTLPTRLRTVLEQAGGRPAVGFGELMGAFLAEAEEWLRAG